MINLTNGVPNLDEQTISDLERFAVDIQTDPRKVAALLFPHRMLFDPQEAIKYANRLGDYANARMWYLVSKDKGLIIKAQVHDAQCQKILDSIPLFARW